MSRQEDFIEAGIKYRFEHGKPMCIAGSNLADVERELNRVKQFEAGAEHGYQYAVEKAFERLTNIMLTDYGTCQISKLLDDLRKAMEE